MRTNRVKEADLLVSILNAVVELLGNDVSKDGYGYTNVDETNSIIIEAANEDSLEDNLAVLWEELSQSYKTLCTTNTNTKQNIQGTLEEIFILRL